MLRSLPYLGIAGVGIGSTVFHATMKNYTQWCKFDYVFLPYEFLYICFTHIIFDELRLLAFSLNE